MKEERTEGKGKKEEKGINMSNIVIICDLATFMQHYPLLFST